MAKHNIFKDSTIFVGRVTCVWLTSAEKAPKMYRHRRFEKVPARTPVAILTTLCGKEIRFSMFNGSTKHGEAQNEIHALRLPDSVGVASFWKWEEGQEEPGLITVKLHNVWFPEDNPNKGYATQMFGLDEINPITKWVDVSDVEDLESKTVHQIQREAKNWSPLFQSCPTVDSLFSAPTCCEQCVTEALAVEDTGYGHTGEESFTFKVQNYSLRERASGEYDYTLKKKASIHNYQLINN
jgi:hypothetical protein